MKRYYAQESSDGKGHLFDFVLQKYTSDALLIADQKDLISFSKELPAT